MSDEAVAESAVNPMLLMRLGIRCPEQVPDTREQCAAVEGHEGRCVAAC